MAELVAEGAIFMIKRLEIEKRISNYSNLIADALDNNDCINALKLRAVQKELEDLISFYDREKNNASSLDITKYYKTVDAAQILGINGAQWLIFCVWMECSLQCCQAVSSDFLQF